MCWLERNHHRLGVGECKSESNNVGWKLLQFSQLYYMNDPLSVLIAKYKLILEALEQIHEHWGYQKRCRHICSSSVRFKVSGGSRS